MKWVEFFKSTKSVTLLPNLKKIISCISPSDAFCERVFSFMKHKATDVHNRMSTELLKSELMITINFDDSCHEFYKMIIKNEELLRAAKSNLKYKFKNK